MCNCVQNVNRQLTDSGARVATLPTAGREPARRAGKPRVIVHTVNNDPMRRNRVLAVATHCPFCGIKYED